MKSSENKLPSSVAEENQSHNWIWRLSTCAVILPLIFVGAVLNVISYHDVPGITGHSPFDIAVDYTSWILFAWGCILLPAILIRMLSGQRLHWCLSLLLAFAGFTLMIMANLALFGNSPPKGSLLLILLLGSAYKVAHSHFGLSSIGIPVSPRGDSPAQSEEKVSLSLKKEEPPITETNMPIPFASPVEAYHNGAVPSFPQPEPGSPGQPTGGHATARTLKYSKSSICSLVLYGIALSILLMQICVRERYQWEVRAITEISVISLICILIPRVCGKLMRDATSKAIHSYQAAKPGNALSYGVITFVFWLTWYAILLGVISMESNIWKSYIFDDELTCGTFIFPLVLQIISYILVSLLFEIGTNPATSTIVWKVTWSSALIILSLALCVLGIQQRGKHIRKLELLQESRIETRSQLNDARSTTRSARKNHDAYQAELQLRNKRLQQIRDRQSEIDKIRAATKQFHQNIQNGNLAAIESNIAAGADINATQDFSWEGQTLQLLPLHAAIIMGHTKVTQLLLQKGANPNTGTADCENALEALVYCTDEQNTQEQFILLLEHGMNPDMCVTLQIPEEQMKKSVNNTIADTYRTYGLSSKALTLGAASNLTPTFQKTKQPTMEQKLSALHVAASEGWEPIVKLLVQKGAKEQRLPSGTPLYLSCQKGYTQIVRLLLDNGADIDYQSPLGWTPLMRSIYNKHSSVASMLIDRGADVNLCTSHGNNAVWFATFRNNPGILEKLLVADANASGGNQRTALKQAIYIGAFECARLLIAHGADLEQVDNQGITAAMAILALRGKDEHWVKLIPADILKRTRQKILRMQRLKRN